MLSLQRRRLMSKMPEELSVMCRHTVVITDYDCHHSTDK